MILIMNFYLFLLNLFIIMMFLYFNLFKIMMYLEFELFNFNSVKLEFLIFLDWISLLFMSVVIMVSLMVIIYSMDYMMDDYNRNRFMMLIYLFVMSMLLMVASPNMISILIGWDGLGMVSYCLVIYYQSNNSFNSGMVTVLTNRLGDLLILISVGLMVSYGSWNFYFFNNLNYLIYFLLILASFTKSAQIPFSSWLPMAMAAPTPVSSLVHSSTLVTAGVYLLLRLNYLLMSKNLINLLMMFSLVTMLLAGLGANFEFDLKKIIALSTLSQLGLMIFSLSLKMEEICLFHLLTHAMFKSLLFMCAGVIIHNVAGNQDIRYISMILFNMPMISMIFNCASLSLCGIPFMSGFFSKDLILEFFLISNFNKFILMILFFSMGLTIMYTFRVLFYSLMMPQLLMNLKFNLYKSYMGISMYLLFFFSIVMGILLNWILFSMKNYIYLMISLKLLIYLFMMMGMIIGMFIPKFFTNNIMYMYMNKMNMFFMSLWFMPMLYKGWIWKTLNFSEKMMYSLDFGWVEYTTKGVVQEIIIKSFNFDWFYKNYLSLLIYYMFMIFIILF